MGGRVAEQISVSTRQMNLMRASSDSQMNLMRASSDSQRQ